MTQSTKIVAIFALVVNVAYAQVSPIINPDKRELLVGEGNTQVLDCHVTVTTQTARLAWSGPNSNLPSKTETQHNQDGTYTIHRILTLENFTTADVGKYTCTYTGTSTTTTDITLSSVKESKKEETFYYRNETGTLSCELAFSGGTSTFKEWLKFNETLPEDDERYTIIPENGTLVINNPTREDAGVYTARYEITGMMAPYEHDCQVVYSAGPLVLNMVKSKNIDEGEDLQVECEIKGYPHATVTWYKDNEILVEDMKRIMIEEHNGYANTLLTVKTLGFDDAGVYSCEANLTGYESDKKSLIVRVKDKLAWLWPFIGIIVEVIVLAIIIFSCDRLQKKRQAQDNQNESRGHGHGHDKDD